MRKKALVVDDNVNNLMLEKDLLEAAGFEVFEAETAANGMAIARREEPDVIVMDVLLPDMRGTQAARILRQHKDTRDILIVFVTASVLPEGLEEIRAITNSGFIGKPINTRTFAQEIIGFLRECPMVAKPVLLVVDDQPEHIELLEAYLVPQGYEIITSASGEEALEKLSANRIDLILLDVMLPGIQGFEVIRRIRQDAAHRVLPIILITVLSEPEDRVKGIEAGCDDFLSKPVDKTELLARVGSLLKVKAYHDLMSNYRIEMESEVTRRTDELRHALENLQKEITEHVRAEGKNLRQLEEVRRWREMTLVREDRNRHLKHEVNELLIRLGEEIRYPSRGNASEEQETAKG